MKEFAEELNSLVNTLSSNNDVTSNATNYNHQQLVSEPFTSMTPSELEKCTQQCILHIKKTITELNEELQTIQVSKEQQRLCKKYSEELYFVENNEYKQLVQKMALNINGRLRIAELTQLLESSTTKDEFLNIINLILCNSNHLFRVIELTKLLEHLTSYKNKYIKLIIFCFY